MQKIYICGNQRAGGAGCIKGSKGVLRALTAHARQRADIEVIKTTCMGYCAKGPNVKIHGGGFFHNVQADDVEGILNALETSTGRKSRSSKARTQSGSRKSV